MLIFLFNATTCRTFRRPSSWLESQLTAFFQIPQILSASGHDVIHVPGHISYLGFLLWHLWLSHPPRAHVNTCAQCVHLTNPCTKRKVLSLTKQKGKIYKTKNDNIKKISMQLYYIFNSFFFFTLQRFAHSWRDGKKSRFMPSPKTPA